MISMEFRAMYPYAPDFEKQLTSLRVKVLARYHDLFNNIKDEFLRALFIIRQKCPSPGTKRARDANLSKVNLLNGIIEWITPEDAFPTKSDFPVLYVKGESNEEQSSAALVWKENIIPLEPNMQHCFRILCESLLVFNTFCHPVNKQFFIFMCYALLGVGNLTTTGERLMQNIQ
ncbi:uncharacterized protein LOC129731255 [Wyeomyia smithii]|uniref:uncharacterized protein LOC129731255 n=1 Tax=Wyeomyia smithii TaxID=174621 RepID=UPI002467FFF3|nr:uncharacterized protein LOC129731255 [Wyeomyia smithii]